MVDYLYSVAIQANLFHNNMADKMVWRINWWRINEYSLHVCFCMYSKACLVWSLWDLSNVMTYVT